MKWNKTRKLQLSYLLVVIANILLPLFLRETYSIQTLSLVFGIVSIIDLLFGLYIWYFKHKTFNSAFLYFIIACYICWFGQIIVCGLRLLPELWIDIRNFSSWDFIRTGTFALLGFGALFFGGLLIYRNHNKVVVNEKIGNSNLAKALLVVSLGMIFVSFFGHYYDLINKLIISLTEGYASLYDKNIANNSPFYNIYSNLKMFFWPGVFLLLIACKGNKKIFKGVLVIAAIDIILNFLIGTRSDALVILLAMFWFYTNEYKNFSAKGYIIVFIILIVLAHLVSTIAAFRILPDKSILLFIKEFFNLGNNAIVKTINEFGFNIFSLHHTMILIPKTDPYAFGYTYFAAVMAIIPSALMGGFSFSAKAALPDWLKTSLGMDYGPGFSILAESFYNFGYMGIIMMFLIGILVGKAVSNKFSGDKRIIKNGIIAILIYLNIFIARDTFLMVFRKIFYNIGIPLLLVVICYKIFTRDSENKVLITFNNLCNKIYNFINSI